MSRRNKSASRQMVESLKDQLTEYFRENVFDDYDYEDGNNMSCKNVLGPYSDEDGDSMEIISGDGIVSLQTDWLESSHGPIFQVCPH